jgi:hypothetical protein
MGSRVPQRLTVVEPIPIIPVYCDGLASAIAIENVMHFCFFVDQQAAGCDGGPIEHVLNLRLLMPAIGVARALPMLIRALPDEAAAEMRDLTRRLVS